MNPESHAALAGCSTATLTMQLPKRGLRATAMRGVRRLAACEAWKQRRAN